LSSRIGSCWLPRDAATVIMPIASSSIRPRTCTGGGCRFGHA
jgi:hypothetical protein